MKKILFTIILLCALTINFSGCTNQNENNESTNIVEKQDKMTSSTIYSKTEKDTESTENFDDDAKVYYIHFNDYNKKFQDGIGVVTLIDENEEYITNAVLNSEGNILLCLSGAGFAFEVNDSYFVEQVGSYFYAHDVSLRDPKNYIIFDASGNILFNVDFTADDNFEYADSGDGYLATIYKNSDYSNSDYRLSFYGLDGSLIREFSLPEDVDCKYYGSNVFKISTKIKNESLDTFEYTFFYNAETDLVFCADTDEMFVSGLSLEIFGTTVVCGYYRSDGTYTDVDNFNLCLLRTNLNLEDKLSDGEYGNILMDGVGVYKSGEKYYIYNSNTQKSYLLSEIDRELYAYERTYVANGYIALPIKGADGGIYIAIYDYEGKCVLNPSSSEKDYKCSCIADNKAFLSNGKNILVYDLLTGEVKKNQESSLSAQYTEYSDGIAIARKYTDDGKSTYETYINEEGDSLFPYKQTQNSIYDDYLPYITVNLENVKKNRFEKY